MSNNTIYNIREGANKYYYDDYTLTLFPGTYSVDDIHEEIETDSAVGIVHFLSKDRKFSLTANNITYNCLLESTFRIDFQSQPDSIGAVLRFSPQILEPNVRHESDRPTTLLDDHHVTIICNIITDVYSNQQASHALHESLVVEEGGYSIREKPSVVLYQPVAVTRISDITLRLVNKRNQLIHLDPHTHVASKLHIKPV